MLNFSSSTPSISSASEKLEAYRIRAFKKDSSFLGAWKPIAQMAGWLSLKWKITNRGVNASFPHLALSFKRINEIFEELKGGMDVLNTLCLTEESTLSENLKDRLSRGMCYGMCAHTIEVESQLTQVSEEVLLGKIRSTPEKIIKYQCLENVRAILEQTVWLRKNYEEASDEELQSVGITQSLLNRVGKESPEVRQALVQQGNLYLSLVQRRLPKLESSWIDEVQGVIDIVTEMPSKDQAYIIQDCTPNAHAFLIVNRPSVGRFYILNYQGQLPWERGHRYSFANSEELFASLGGYIESQFATEGVIWRIQTHSF